MNYNELVQLYFERSNAIQGYWNLYVIVVGGLLAFSSLRKQPAAITTLIVSVLFGLFAYENHDAIQIATGQRLATHAAITKFDASRCCAEHENGARPIGAYFDTNESRRSANNPCDQRYPRDCRLVGDGNETPTIGRRHCNFIIVECVLAVLVSSTEFCK